jgi:hypothetical protein
LDEVQRASSSASNEAAAKGEDKNSQVAAANNAASNAIMMGRAVQKVVKGITMKAKDEPSVTVKATPTMVSPDGEGVLNSTSIVVSVKRETPSPSDVVPDTPGQQLLEAVLPIPPKSRKRSPAKVSHLQVLIRNAAQQAAESSVVNMAKQELIVSPDDVKKAAFKAAKTAAKKTVLAEVHQMATHAAHKAKEAIKSKGKDVKAQSDAAAAAASQAAKHVLSIAKSIEDDVVKGAAEQGVQHMLRVLKEKAKEKAKAKAEDDDNGKTGGEH